MSEGRTVGAQVGERHIEVDGARLAVSVAGQGRPFLWGHGVTASRAQEDDIGLFPWDLSPEARLVRYDARGHGRSTGRPDPGDYRWEHLAGDALAVADALGLDRFVAGGASLGAATALHVAVMAPDRVEALVLVIPPVAWERRPAQAAQYEKMASIIEAKGLARFVEIARRAAPPYPFLAEAMPHVKDVFLAHMATADEALAPHVFRGAARSDLPAVADVEGVTCPSLVLTWAGDPGHPSENAEEVATALGADLHVATDPGELSSWRQRVLGFLQGLP